MQLKYWASIVMVLACGVAQAAKIPVSWQNPTENVDGTPLTNLKAVTVEWGTCNGVAFGTRQASITVPTTEPGKIVKGFIYPSGIKKVCLRAFAISATDASSDASSVANKDVLPKAGKPVTLAPPVIIN